MPLYEFRCENSHLHELMLSMSAADRHAACPECGSDATRLISSPALGHLRTARADLIGETGERAPPAVVDRVPGARPDRPAPSRRRRARALPRP
ncbi:zinc ribbon domain-containing protein [Brachybacterium sp. JB7]|uniref:FmdB family zinc ribbon protein n=1 Tax=Brachybacterium sp. JB7 TaxID=2024478 RepID=UPI000DF4C8E5|nr:zinc ribbon domain-containing protein [Brachybacterium sp. JB7]RCS65021.1 zinc ribbon domain-containing protein [Brachybacterium sp. JB7]